jgi:hypothetical protein
MRNFVLIAAMVLASVAAAQAGESRSLITDSTAGVTAAANVTSPLPNADQPALPRAPGALRADNDTPSADAPRTDTPRYNVRPAPVETPRAATTTPPAAQDTPAVSTNNAPPPRQATMSRPSREYHASRGYVRHQRGRLTAGRIIAALHRYGIYW